MVENVSYAILSVQNAKSLEQIHQFAKYVKTASFSTRDNVNLNKDDTTIIDQHILNYSWLY